MTPQIAPGFARLLASPAFPARGLSIRGTEAHGQAKKRRTEASDHHNLVGSRHAKTTRDGV